MLRHAKSLFADKMSIANINKTVAVILGATGTGKSKLAIEIAKKYNGEVINADSMQIYKGLDIATNKVSKEERQTVPHHMIDFQDPLRVYNVVDYRNDVLPLIERIHNDGKLPVIVGGTHYYIEAILWKILVQSENFEFSDQSKMCFSKVDILERISVIRNFVKDNISDKSVDNFVNKFSVRKCTCCTDSSNTLTKNEENIQCMNDCSCNINLILGKVKELLYVIPSDNLLRLLEIVDPEMSQIYHPNNRRKIIRSIEVWIQTGVCHSVHIQNQLEEVGDMDLGGSIRFQNSALLWITCNQEILDKRLDDRVDSMMMQGLLKELSEFWSLYYPIISKSKDLSSNLLEENHHKQGIFQCIGFKEFTDYLDFGEEQEFLQDSKNKYSEAVELMKLRTRQYSRRQLKWIKNRFLLRHRMRIPVYSVDGTNMELWDEKVSSVANEVVESILTGRKPITPPVELPTSFNKTLYLVDKTRNFCKVCARFFIGTHQWNEHLKGLKHRRMMKRNCSEKKDLQKLQKVM